MLMGANSFANKDELKLALNGDITDIANWDVSKVTDMSRLFHAQHLPNFNANISNWNTSSATTMFATFYEAHAFNQPLSWDTSKVTNMNSMFCRAYKFDQPLSFDTSKVTSMGYMFEVRSARALLAPTALSRALPVHMPLASPPSNALTPPGPHLFPRHMPAFRLGSPRRRSTSRSASTRPRSRTCAPCSTCAPRVPWPQQP